MAQINQSKQVRMQKKIKNKKVYGREPDRTVEMSFKTANGGVVRYPVDVFTV
jgi:hypothetical protein